MPITQERQTMQDLRGAGFSPEQAEVLAEKLEAAEQATQQDLKEFIRQEFAQSRQEMNTRFAEQEARFERALRMQLATILTAVVAVTTLAVAIIKLFPNAH
ncbi:MAG: hypothetical protein ACHQZQ_06395 [SAR324 cluster bacterium]